MPLVARSSVLLQSHVLSPLGRRIYVYMNTSSLLTRTCPSTSLENDHEARSSHAHEFLICCGIIFTRSIFEMQPR